MATRTTPPTVTLALAAAGLLAAAGAAPADPPPRGVQLRVATQAPEGTVWMDAMTDIKTEVERRSRDRVRFLFYPNGSQGDEKAVIERMEAGLIHGGLFTGIGLGEILPKVRILEMPFFYRNIEEIDAVKAALEDEFRAGFEEEGFVFLGWAEVGWAYIFSKQEAANLDELRERKIWVWQGDPLAERVFQAFELNGVPLPLTDVLTSLNTGMIDSVYNSPYGLVGLQWHRDLRFMSRMTVGYGTGALLVTKSQWDKIPPAMRDGISRLARSRLDRLVTEIREKNEETTAELEENGMRIVPLPEDELPTYIETGEQVAEEMVGELYDRAFLDRVKAVLAEHRGEDG